MLVVVGQITNDLHLRCRDRVVERLVVDVLDVHVVKDVPGIAGGRTRSSVSPAVGQRAPDFRKLAKMNSRQVGVTTPDDGLDLSHTRCRLVRLRFALGRPVTVRTPVGERPT